MQPLRVGIDGHVLDGKYQGTRTWLLEILRRAPALAPEIEFVVYTAEPGRTDELLGRVRVVNRPLPEVDPITRNLRLWPRLMRDDRLDVLITQYFCSPRGARRQIPVIHDVLFETHPAFFPARTRWRNRLLVAWGARRAPHLMTVSSYSRDQIARIYRRDEASISIVNNGVDVSSFACETSEAPSVTGGLPYGLFVGRLEPRKNLRLALAALALIDDPNARLVVVGRDDFEDAAVLQALVDEPRAVHLVDVSDAELRALYRNAAALVFPSLGEGWGIPLLEAQAAGTPVIASDATAIPEAGGPACHYFSPTAPDAAERLATLFRSALAGELAFDADVAATHVHSLTWDHSAEQFVAALRAAVPAIAAAAR